LVKAKNYTEGEDITIVTYGSGVHWAIEYANQNKDVQFIFLT
jgi:2-oxoisovalerate dehydrogenase E1 component